MGCKPKDIVDIGNRAKDGIKWVDYDHVVECQYYKKLCEIKKQIEQFAETDFFIVLSDFHFKVQDLLKCLKDINDIVKDCNEV